MKVNNRSGYRRICVIFRRYRPFTTDEAYQTLIHQLIVMYPRRRALIEELQLLLHELEEENSNHHVEQLSIEIA